MYLSEDLTMLLIPQIKKKIAGFIKDENGTISKGNLIKGGILLGSIGASIRIVEASFYLKNKEKIPDTTRTIPNDPGGCLDPIKYLCTADTQTEGVDPDTMDVPRTTCDTYDYWGTIKPSTGANRHANSGTIVHRNALRQNSHRNTVGLSIGSQNPDNLVGTHSHHGQHFNIDSIDVACGSVAHKSVCWHSSHSSGGWCL
jgi:hypothetical protein